MIARAPGGSTHEFDRRTPEESGLEEVKWRPTMENLFTLPGIIAGLLRGAKEAPSRVEELARENDRLLAKARLLDIATAPYPSIMEWLGESRAFVNHLMAQHIIVSELATNYYDLLVKLTAKWLGDGGGTLASRLVTGLQTLESARPNIGIWDLSRQVCEAPELREIFETTPLQEILPRLECDLSPRTGGFLLSLRSFLDDFGYRGVFEGEAMTLNWEEDPAYVFGMIRNYLDAGPASDPREHAHRQEQGKGGGHPHFTRPPGRRAAPPLPLYHQADAGVHPPARVHESGADQTPGPGEGHLPRPRPQVRGGGHHRGSRRHLLPHQPGDTRTRPRQRPGHARIGTGGAAQGRVREEPRRGAARTQQGQAATPLPRRTGGAAGRAGAERHTREPGAGDREGAGDHRPEEQLTVRAGRDTGRAGHRRRLDSLLRHRCCYRRRCGRAPIPRFHRSAGVRHPRRAQRGRGNPRHPHRPVDHRGWRPRGGIPSSHRWRRRAG